MPAAQTEHADYSHLSAVCQAVFLHFREEFFSSIFGIILFPQKPAQMILYRFVDTESLALHSHQNLAFIYSEAYNLEKIATKEAAYDHLA